MAEASRGRDGGRFENATCQAVEPFLDGNLPLVGVARIRSRRYRSVRNKI